MGAGHRRRTGSVRAAAMLADWAELLVFTDHSQADAFPVSEKPFQVWPLPDIYPRPFNADLLPLVRRLIAEKGLA